MASELRAEWQNFKKKHPLFEKSKGFKSDVGPQLDKYIKARDEHHAAQDLVFKRKAAVIVTAKSVAAALVGYEVVVKDVAAKDPTIVSDFDVFARRIVTPG